MYTNIRITPLGIVSVATKSQPGGNCKAGHLYRIIIYGMEKKYNNVVRDPWILPVNHRVGNYI